MRLPLSQNCPEYWEYSKCGDTPRVKIHRENPQGLILTEARWSELSCHHHGQNPINGTTTGSRYPTRRL
jgi:hypothetical protein